MKLIFLGTSAALPTVERGLSGLCVERDGELLLFDAGEGSQMAFMRAHLGWNKPMRIFVTHMHGDHCIGILGMIQTMSMKQRSEPLEIYGPPGIDEFIAQNLRILGVLPSFAVSVKTVREGFELDGGSYVIRAAAAEHRTEAYSFLLTENDRPGRFHPDKAKALGVPEGNMWHDLQSGRDITINGKTVRPSEVMDGPRPGLRVGVSGDTRPTQNLEKLFEGCDWLIFESTFSHDLHDKALETMHTTAREAGQLAAKCGAKNLILTHFSARHNDVSQLVAQAKELHGSVTAAYDGLEIDL